MGRIPSLSDFDDFGDLDIQRIFDNNSLKSYHKFLSKYEKDYSIKFSELEEKFLEFISVKFANGKRIHELILLKILLEEPNETDVLGRFKFHSTWKLSCLLQRKTKINLINQMTANFATGSSQKTYKDCIFIEEENGNYKISFQFRNLLQNSYFSEQIAELIEFGLARNKKRYAEHNENSNFCLYSKYTYEDVCRLLDWEKGEVALNIGGYKYDKKTKTYPVFVNYDKDANINASIRYEDHFIDDQHLIAISKSGRTSQSEDVQSALNADKLGIQMLLFVRKNKDDRISKEFYYLGPIHATGDTKDFTMANTEKTAVEIEYHLEKPIAKDLYQYLIG